MMVDHVGANQLVESQLATHLSEIETHMGVDCLTYVGPIIYGADDMVRLAIEELRGGTRRRGSRLLFILESEGGYAEVTRRISDALRHHYIRVDFLVPSHAMSAGTILAMSGDAIWMDYYSVLGPIDPQVPSPDQQRLIPALGYLIRYHDLLDKANKGQAGAAELQILLSFDQGELYSFEQARDLSVALLEEWLAKYKFRNWKVTESTGKKVTPTMKRNRAKEIANSLNDVSKWNSHGIGIGMNILERDLNLKIDDFGEDDMLNDSVRAYHRLLTDYMQRMNRKSAIHTRETYGHY